MPFLARFASTVERSQSGINGTLIRLRPKFVRWSCRAGASLGRRGDIFAVVGLFPEIELVAVERMKRSACIGETVLTF